jgi:hypothetical protein
MNLTRAPKCIACGSEELLSVSFTMADGPVDMWTCSSCEATSWERSGGRVSREAAWPTSFAGNAATSRRGLHPRGIESAA